MQQTSSNKDLQPSNQTSRREKNSDREHNSRSHSNHERDQHSGHSKSSRNRHHHHHNNRNNQNHSDNRRHSNNNQGQNQQQQQSSSGNQSSGQHNHSSNSHRRQKQQSKRSSRSRSRSRDNRDQNDRKNYNESGGQQSNQSKRHSRQRSNSSQRKPNNHTQDHRGNKQQQNYGKDQQHKDYRSKDQHQSGGQRSSNTPLSSSVPIVMMHQNSSNSSKPRTDIKVREIWVGNLPESITKETLYSYFFVSGEIEDIELIRHKNYPYYGYVRFMLTTCTKRAYDVGQNLEIDGRKLKVQYTDYNKRQGISGDKPGYDLTSANCTTIFVAFSVSVQLPQKSMIESIFSQFGKVRAIWMRQTSPNTQFRSHAFVDYTKPEEAQLAVKEMFHNDRFGQRRLELGDKNCEILLAIRKRCKDFNNAQLTSWQQAAKQSQPNSLSGFNQGQYQPQPHAIPHNQFNFQQQKQQSNSMIPPTAMQNHMVLHGISQQQNQQQPNLAQNMPSEQNSGLIQSIEMTPMFQSIKQQNQQLAKEILDEAVKDPQNLLAIIQKKIIQSQQQQQQNQQTSQPAPQNMVNRQIQNQQSNMLDQGAPSLANPQQMVSPVNSNMLSVAQNQVFQNSMLMQQYQQQQVQQQQSNFFRHQQQQNQMLMHQHQHHQQQFQNQQNNLAYQQPAPAPVPAPAQNMENTSNQACLSTKTNGGQPAMDQQETSRNTQVQQEEDKNQNLPKSNSQRDLAQVSSEGQVTSSMSIIEMLRKSQSSSTNQQAQNQRNQQEQESQKEKNKINSSQSPGKGPRKLRAQSIFEEDDAFVWSGFITRNKQHRVGVDAFTLQGENNELYLCDYNLNISHRTNPQDILNHNIQGVVAFKPQNPTQEGIFRDQIDYFQAKQRIGLAFLRNGIMFLMPPSEDSKKFFQGDDSGPYLLGLFGDQQAAQAQQARFASNQNYQ